MAVQLSIPYETLLELVEQLPSEQQASLIQHLQKRHQSFTAEERKAWLDALVNDSPALNQAPSIRREDWYGDDGR